MKKKLTGSILLFFILITGTAFCQGAQPEQLIVPLSSPDKPCTLNVGLVSGSIKVTGYTGKDVVIDVSLPGSKSKKETVEDAGNGMKKISPKSSLDVSAHEDNNVVTVNNENFNRAVIFTIKVPQGAKLKLSTVNGGDIDVDNIKGELEVNNVNGAIRLTNISGSVVATTVNGDVITTFTDIDAKPMAFSTLNGNVDVTFPASFKSNLKLKSDRGEIFTDFDVDIDKTEKPAEHINGNGMYRLKVDDWVKGKVNGGGAEILMKNMEGNIYLRKKK